MVVEGVIGRQSAVGTGAARVVDSAEGGDGVGDGAGSVIPPLAPAEESGDANRVVGEGVSTAGDHGGASAAYQQAGPAADHGGASAAPAEERRQRTSIAVLQRKYEEACTTLKSFLSKPFTEQQVRKGFDNLAEWVRGPQAETGHPILAFQQAFRRALAKFVKAGSEALDLETINSLCRGVRPVLEVTQGATEKGFDLLRQVEDLFNAVHQDSLLVFLRRVLGISEAGNGFRNSVHNFFREGVQESTEGVLNRAMAAGNAAVSRAKEAGNAAREAGNA